MPINSEEIKQDHKEYIEKLFEDLKNKINQTSSDNSKLAEAVISAQLFENKLTCFKEKKYDDLEDFANKMAIDSNELYKNLFKVYDRTSDNEIVELLMKSVQIDVKKYIDGLSYIGELSNEKLIEILAVRDRIKVLFDEIELWKDRFQERDQIQFEKHDSLFGEVKAVDGKLRDELIVNNLAHAEIYEEAEKRLVKRPDGTQRFNFWWWFAGNN